MDVTFFLSKEDFVILESYIISNDRDKQKSLKLQRWVFPIILLLISFYFFATANYLLGCIQLFFVAYSFYRHPAQMKSFYAKRASKYFDNQYGKKIKRKLTFSKEGIKGETALGESLVLWSNIEKLVEIKGYILMEIDNERLVIPTKQIEKIIDLKHVIKESIAPFSIEYKEDFDWDFNTFRLY